MFTETTQRDRKRTEFLWYWSAGSRLCPQRERKRTTFWLRTGWPLLIRWTDCLPPALRLGAAPHHWL